MKIYYNGTCYGRAIYNGEAVYHSKLLGSGAVRYVNSSTSLRLTGDGKFRLNN